MVLPDDIGKDVTVFMMGGHQIAGTVTDVDEAEMTAILTAGSNEITVDLTESVAVSRPIPAGQ